MRKDGVAKTLAVFFILTGTALADDDVKHGDRAHGRAPTIRVIGTGSVRVQPDIAVINIGVSTEDANAQNAVAHNTDLTTKVISELENASIAKKDVRTSNFSIYPQNRTEGSDKHVVTIYRVSNTVNVTIRDLGKVGDILTRVVAAGSNQITGPHFSVSNPEMYLSEARKKAVENAMAKANNYASAAGLKLGPVREIAEEAAAAPAHVGSFRGMAAPAAAVPVESGEESLQARVLLIIELVPQ